jgi:hypothetical protein
MRKQQWPCRDGEALREVEGRRGCLKRVAICATIREQGSHTHCCGEHFFEGAQGIDIPVKMAAALFVIMGRGSNDTQHIVLGYLSPEEAYIISIEENIPAAPQAISQGWSKEDYNNAMAAAAKLGSQKVVRLCREQGATDYDSAMLCAAIGGYAAILRLCKQWDDVYRAEVLRDHPAYISYYPEEDKTYDEEMVMAAAGGHEAAVRLCYQWGVKRYNGAIARAAEGGHEDLIRLFEEWGVLDYEYAMLYAAAGGSEKIMRQCKAWGATNYNRAMVYAASAGHEAAVRLCKQWGATNYDTAETYAMNNGHAEIVRLCGKWMAGEDA